MYSKNWIDINSDDYADVSAQFMEERQARRKRKQKAKHLPKKSQSQIVAELADVNASEDRNFETTYNPSRYEAGWLMESLQEFYRQEYITDVLGQVRGGKEASVYRCAARPDLGVEYLAAKVYRPRQFRQLRNDKMYREGRAILTPEGDVVKETDHRIIRAIGKKTDYGVQVEHSSWLMYEFNTLQQLHQAGAAVPKPYASAENAILMEYIGDGELAGPTLSVVELEADEAESLFQETLRNIDLMLTLGFIHGDLSAYNILYWEGQITMIDFPQVTDSRFNQQAKFILQRDIERVCEYFNRYGLKADAKAIFHRLWQRHIDENRNVQADISRRTVDEDGWSK